MSTKLQSHLELGDLFYPHMVVGRTQFLEVIDAGSLFSS
jgi:hypothetical protein